VNARTSCLALAVFGALLVIGLIVVVVRAVVPAPPERPGGPAAGQAVPSGQLPPSTPTPRLVFFQKEPYGPVKVDPKTVHVVDLGRLERGTQVRAVVTVAFNQSIANLSGTPDIDLRVEGPSGVVTQVARARNGTQLAFQTPADGQYRIVLGNEYSQVNAKQVGVQFLAP
jgi:hypothetical protein